MHICINVFMFMYIHECTLLITCSRYSYFRLCVWDCVEWEDHAHAKIWIRWFCLFWPLHSDILHRRQSFSWIIIFMQHSNVWLTNNLYLWISRNYHFPVPSMLRSGLSLHLSLDMDSILYGLVGGWPAFLLMTKGLVINGAIVRLCFTHVLNMYFLYECI